MSKKYPMSYEEFEKRVVELFLEDYSDETLQVMKDKVDKELENDPNYIHGFYGHACWVYDNPKLYGKNCKKVFEDNFLRQTPVANLRMLIG